MVSQPITGKTVVVTGGSRGIGLGLVKKFLSRDNTVVATSRRVADAAALQTLQLQYPAGRLILTDLDISAPCSITAWAEGVKGAGFKHVDVLVNNAGMYGRRPTLEDFSEEDFLTAFRTNAMGPFFVVQQLLKQDLLGHPPPSQEDPAAAAAPSSSSSSPTAPTPTPATSPTPTSSTPTPATSSTPTPTSLVANISSIVASNTEPTVSAALRGGFAYRASKAALNVISTTLARDLWGPRGVAVVALHPGYVRTDLSGGLGWIDVEESAEGLVGVMESAAATGGWEAINGRFLSYTGEEIPW